MKQMLLQLKVVLSFEWLNVEQSLMPFGTLSANTASPYLLKHDTIFVGTNDTLVSTMMT